MKMIPTFEVGVTLDTFTNTGDKINTIPLCSRDVAVLQKSRSLTKT